MPEFSVASVQHRVLGRQIRLRFADDIELRFTPAEASSLSLALVAVSRGISPEREIYMSPIASDEAFVGKVHETGMRITVRDEELALDWDTVENLSAGLAAAIG
ncbi:MAG: hypothetical protein KKF58_05970 [Gammaproteobacteria bacterium]|nr:hypothetical protein [Gammaproteobacteria bacterium]MBU1447839.1 hypothetical protein [Gammaproteobacteria bacterium]